MPQNFGECKVCGKSVVDLFAKIAELEAALTIAHKWMAPGVRSIPVSDKLREMHERELRQVEMVLRTTTSQ